MRPARWRDLLQEMVELGPAGVAFRLRWELALRSGWIAAAERVPAVPRTLDPRGVALVARLPFAAAPSVREAMGDRVGRDALLGLEQRARAAARGRIRCFGRWDAEFGDPVDWHLNPVTRQRWAPGAHWSEILADTGRVGDVKLTWEVGRFPHAYELARAAALGALPAADGAGALARQIESFVASNAYGRGVHWASGQEIVIRLTAWLFAVSVLRDEPPIRAVLPAVQRHLHQGAVHLERYFDYARKAVYNNHLVSEAFGLYLAGALLPEAPQSRRWVALGMDTLTEQAARQVHPDGGYLMHSHNYHRAALQMFLLALAVRRREGGVGGGAPDVNGGEAGGPARGASEGAIGAPPEVPRAWTAALTRSLDFLLAHQNPRDGSLPNFGSNDGALPAVLSTCDYSDFRPLLQAVSLATRGERLYEPGPWDEEAAWLLGPASLSAPLRARPRGSVSFTHSGFHVLRGGEPGTFASFRCGTLRERFTQIDMLQLDVFWRGENVLVDGGTYLYNGPDEWLRHFTGGASHNTLTVDGRDQMVHHRRFKLLYLTRARLLRFSDAPDHAVAEGEHYGFRRHPGRCVHRRSVLFVKDDLWVVADTLRGSGRHDARLHWLAGPFPHSYDLRSGRLRLDTPRGPFTVTVLGNDSRPLAGELIAGQERPPRGWSSRYYGEKRGAPSLAVTQSGPAPLGFVSILSSGEPQVTVEGGRWRVEVGGVTASFRIREGRFEEVATLPRAILAS